MLASDWLNRVLPEWSLGSERRRKARRAIPTPAQVETLEDRCLLAAFFVSNLNDSGEGSLRQAVLDANNNGNPSETDAIRFVPGLLNTSRVIALTSGQLTVTQSVSILGPTFDAGGIIVSGSNNSRVFQVSSTAGVVLMQYFTITQGSTGGDGGGVLSSGPNTILTDMVVSGNFASSGGGLSVAQGRVEIQRSQIISNSASSDGGGVSNGGGLLIINDTTLGSNVADNNGGAVAVASNASQTLIGGTTISHNTAASGAGGGLVNFDTSSNGLSIQNSTIVGNVSSAGGGGIMMATTGGANLMNLTIAKNIDFDFGSSTGGGGISRTGSGTLTAINSVVSQNFSNSGNGDTNPGAINGTSSQANLIGVDPLLGPLQDNGGPTFTMMPLPGSPVLGNGVTTGTTMLDQRGYARNVSSSGNGAPSVDQGAVEFFPTLTQPYIVGPGANTGNRGSRAYSSNSRSREPRFDNLPYPGFFGEVRVALADINGDGTKDIVTVPGPGGGPNVRVRNGIDPSQILQNYMAYDPLYFGGVFVAAGDIDNDGTPDIITGSGQGASHVRVFSGQNQTLLLNLFPFGGFTGGVRVASGDIDNDGRADIIVAAGPGAGPHVKVYSGAQVLANPTDASLIGGTLGSFFAYAPNFGGGVFIAAGDMNHDGSDELITGAGEGGGPHVLVFTNTVAGPIVGFFAYGTTFAGGVRVGVVDLDGDKFEDIVTGAGPGGGPHVRIVSGRVLTNFSTPTDLASFFAYDATFTGGVYVGGSDVSLGGGSPLHIDDSFLPPESPAEDITPDDLAKITNAAIDRFESAGLGSEELARLQTVSVEFADLHGTLLGLSVGGRIFIDADAAGFGFFVDATPGDDIEFQTATGQALDGPARNRVDLLTVIMHELAHVLGLPDADADLAPDDLLADRLAPGVRRFLTEQELAEWDTVFQFDDLAGLMD